MNLQHILLTTDLSDEALRPFESVMHLAKAMGAKVTVLHVVQDVPLAATGAPFAPPISVPNLDREAERARERLAEQCADLPGGVEIALEIITHEHPAHGIVEYAVENDVDLIALSTHGRTGLRRLALGSMAEEVLRRSKVPVLSFHRPEE